MTSRVSQLFTLLERYVGAFESYAGALSRSMSAQALLADSSRKRNDVLNRLDEAHAERNERALLTVEGIEARLDAIGRKITTLPNGDDHTPKEEGGAT